MLFRLAIFYMFLVPITAVFALLGVCSVIFPSEIRYYLITRWSVIFIFLAKNICGLNYQVHGFENIPNSPCVVLANHQSMWETIFMQVLLPPQCWVLKRELLWIPFFGWGLAMLQPIAIDRANRFSVKQVIEIGRQRLRQGRWVVMFPEGTRVAVNQRKPFNKTGAALACKAEVPILPIAHNAGVFWPRGPWIKRAGTVKVVIGEPIITKDKQPEILTQQVEQWISKQLF